MIKYEQWPVRMDVGGQHVGTGPSGVRGVHYLIDSQGHEYPTGIEACCSIERSQHKNKMAVEQMIEWACSSTRTPFDPCQS